MFFDFLRRIKVLLIVISVILAALLAVWVLCRLFYIPDTAFCEGVGEYSLVAENEAQREEFFLPFGYKAKSLASYEIKVPSIGDTFEEYNEIQKVQGLDLLPFSGRDAQMYVFSLESMGNEELYGFLIVCKGRVAGAHLSSCRYPADVRGLWEQGS